MNGCCQIQFQIEEQDELFFSLCCEYHGIEGDLYQGEYEVIPKAFEFQTLETKNKTLTQDVKVFEIPYAETTNTFGTTVSIAS